MLTEATEPPAGTRRCWVFFIFFRGNSAFKPPLLFETLQSDKRHLRKVIKLLFFFLLVVSPAVKKTN